jgi:putative addiction module component (TIGR02574 family)
MITPKFSDLLKLSPAERIQLAQDLWDSILDEPEAVPLTEEQRQELDRRLAEHERDPSTAIPWEVVRSRLQERFGV